MCRTVNQANLGKKKPTAEGRTNNLKPLVSVRLHFFPGFTNDSGSSESSLGMVIKAKLNLTFIQNVICKPPAMPSLLIFPSVSFNFYPSAIHNLKFKERYFLFSTLPTKRTAAYCSVIQF